MTTTQAQAKRPDTSFMGLLNARMISPFSTSTTTSASGGGYAGGSSSGVTYLTPDQRSNLGMSSGGGSSRAPVVERPAVVTSAGKPATGGVTSMYLKDQPGQMQPYERPKNMFYPENIVQTIGFDKAYQNKWWDDFGKKILSDYDVTKQKPPTKKEIYKHDISYLSKRNLEIGAEVQKTSSLKAGLSYLPFVGGLIGKDPIGENVNWQYVSTYSRAKGAVTGLPDITYRNMLGSQTYVPQQKVQPTELEAVHLDWAGKNVKARYMDIGNKLVQYYAGGKSIQTAFNEVGTGFNYVTTRYGGKATERIISALYPAWEATKLGIGGYIGYKGGKSIATDVQNKEYLGATEKGLELGAMVTGGATTPKTSTFGITTTMAKWSSKFTPAGEGKAIAFTNTPSGIAWGKPSEYFKSFAERAKSGEPTTAVHSTNYPRGYQKMTILEGGKSRDAEVFVMEAGRKGGFFSVPDFATGGTPTSAYYFGQRNLPSTTLARSVVEQWKETKGVKSGITYPGRVFSQYYKQVGAPVGELKVQSGIDITNPSVRSTTHPGGRTGKAELEIVQKWGAMERTSKDVEFTIRPGTNEFYRIERYNWLDPAKTSLKQGGKTIYPEGAPVRTTPSSSLTTFRPPNMVTDMQYARYGNIGSKTGYSLLGTGLGKGYPAGAPTREYASYYNGGYKSGAYAYGSKYKAPSYEGTKPYKYVQPKYVPMPKIYRSYTPEKTPDYVPPPYTPTYTPPSYGTGGYITPSYTPPYTPPIGGGFMGFASGGGLPFVGRKRKALRALRGFYKPDVFSINFGITGGQGGFTSPFLRPM